MVKRSWLDDLLDAEDFDLSDPTHVAAVIEITSDYGEVLEDESRPHALCPYQPTSELPYSKKEIRKALKAAHKMASGQVDTDLLPASANPGEDWKNAVEGGLIFLANYVDIPGDQLPTDTLKNVAFVDAYRETGSLEEARRAAGETPSLGHTAEYVSRIASSQTSYETDEEDVEQWSWGTRLFAGYVGVIFVIAFLAAAVVFGGALYYVVRELLRAIGLI